MKKIVMFFALLGLIANAPAQNKKFRTDSLKVMYHLDAKGNANVRDSLVVTNNVHANKYYGDGSHLSGVSGSVAEAPVDLVLGADSDINGSGDVIFKAGGVEKARMLNNGNWGLGVSAPTSLLRLHTSGSTALQMTNSITGSTSADGIILSLRADNGNFGLRMLDSLDVFFETDGTERMRIDASGKVLLGYSSTNITGSLISNGSLVVANSDSNLISMGIGGGVASISSARNPGATTAYLPLTFWTSGAKRMTIDTTSGHIGLKVTSPASLFHVNQDTFYTAAGGMKITTANTGQALADGASLFFDSADNFFIKNHQAGYLSLQTDATERVRIGADGRVGIGAAAGTSVALDVTSTDGALRVPRMTQTQRDALTGSAGMQVYSTSTNKFYFRQNAAWDSLGGAISGGLTPAAARQHTGWTSDGTTARDTLATTYKLQQSKLLLRRNQATNIDSVMFDPTALYTRRHSDDGTLLSMEDSTGKYWSAIGLGGIDASGTNQGGAALTFRAAASTGTGSSNGIIFQTPVAGSSGATVNTPSNRVVIGPTGGTATATLTALSSTNTGASQVLQLKNSSNMLMHTFTGDGFIGLNGAASSSSYGINMQGSSQTAGFNHFTSSNGGSVFHSVGITATGHSSNVTNFEIASVTAGSNTPKIIFDYQNNGDDLTITGTSVVLGNGDGTNGTLTSDILRAPNGSGTNIAAASTFQIQGGLATGNAASGGIAMQTGQTGSTGTTLQTAITRVHIGVDGTSSSAPTDSLFNAVGGHFNRGLKVDGNIPHVSIGAGSSLTLSAPGAATVTGATRIVLDSNASAALDTAVTLTGIVGQLIYISTTADARDITFLDSGNFSLSGEHLLDDTDDVLVLMAITTTTWKEVSFSNNN